MLESNRPVVHRPWMGRSLGGWIQISAQQVVGGYGDWIYLHESTHDSLSKATPFGHLQLLLWSLLTYDFPSGELKSRARVLIGLTVQASRAVHEATATFVATRWADRSPTLAPEDRQAMSALTWLDTRMADREDVGNAALEIARVALFTEIQERWFAERLWDPARLERHLAEPRHRPSDRFVAATSTLAARPPALVRAALRYSWLEQWSVLDPGRTVPIGQFVTPGKEELTAFARAFREQLRQQHVLSASERRALDQADEDPFGGVNAHVPASVATQITSAVARSYAVVPKSDWISVASRALLVVVQANLGPIPISDDDGARGPHSEALQPDEVRLSVFTTDLDAAFRLPYAEYVDVIEALHENAVVCATYPFYDVSLTDYTDQGPLSGRPHIALLGATPYYLISSFANAGSFGGETDVAVALIRHRPENELLYCLMRPRHNRRCIAMIPTIARPLSRIVDSLERASGLTVQAMAADDFASETELLGLRLVAEWFSNAPSSFVDELGVTFFAGPGPGWSS